MIWVRGFVALLLTALVLVFMGAIGLTVARGGTDGPPPAWADRFIPKPSAADAAALNGPYADLAAGRSDRLVAGLADGVDRKAAAPQIEAMRKLTPTGPVPAARTLLWTRSWNSDGVHRLSASQEYVYPQRVVRTETTLVRAGDVGPWRIETFYVRSATPAELAANRLDLLKAPPLVVAVVIAAVVNMLLTWLTAMKVLFGQGVRRRWLWLPVVLFGVGKLTVNAATGAFSVMPVSILLFGAAATWTTSAFDAWVIAVGLPLGALVFWLRRLTRGRG